MAGMRNITDAELSREYKKYTKISKKFSKKGTVNNKNGLVDAISNEVSKDKKVEYVEKHFEEAKRLKYDKIFGEHPTVAQFFNTCIPDKWIDKLQKNSIICGKLVSEYETYGYGIEKCGDYWFVWLIGKEIRERAKIAAKGIEGNKPAGDDFSPKWNFISSAKMNDVAKAMTVKATMANVAKEAAAKGAKKTAEASDVGQKQRQNEQSGPGISSTSKKESNRKSTKHSHRRNSVAVAEGVSDTKKQIFLKKSSSKLSLNKTKKSKDDTSEPNQRDLKNLRTQYKIGELKNIDTIKYQIQIIKTNKHIQKIEQNLGQTWASEYLKTLDGCKNIMSYVEKFINDNKKELWQYAKCKKTSNDTKTPKIIDEFGEKVMGLKTIAVKCLRSAGVFVNKEEKKQFNKLNELIDSCKEDINNLEKSNSEIKNFYEKNKEKLSTIDKFIMGKSNILDYNKTVRKFNKWTISIYLEKFNTVNPPKLKLDAKDYFREDRKCFLGKSFAPKSSQNGINETLLVNTSKNALIESFSALIKEINEHGIQDIINKNIEDFKKNSSRLVKIQDNFIKRAQKIIDDVYQTIHPPLGELKIKLNGIEYNFKNFNELKNTALQILNDMNELHYSECKPIEENFRNLAKKLQKDYTWLHEGATGLDERQVKYYKEFYKILDDCKTSQSEVGQFIREKDGKLSTSFTVTINELSKVNDNLESNEKEYVAWQFFKNKNLTIGSGGDFDKDTIKLLDAGWGNIPRLYSCGVSQLVRVILQFKKEKSLQLSSAVQKSIDNIKNCTSKLETLETQLRKNFSEKSKNELDDLMEKAKKNKLSSEEQSKSELKSEIAEQHNKDEYEKQAVIDELMRDRYRGAGTSDRLKKDAELKRLLEEKQKLGYKLNDEELNISLELF